MVSIAQPYQRVYIWKQTYQTKDWITCSHCVYRPSSKWKKYLYHCFWNTYRYITLQTASLPVDVRDKYSKRQGWCWLQTGTTNVIKCYKISIMYSVLHWSLACFEGLAAALMSLFRKLWCQVPGKGRLPESWKERKGLWPLVWSVIHAHSKIKTCITADLTKQFYSGVIYFLP